MKSLEFLGPVSELFTILVRLFILISLPMVLYWYYERASKSQYLAYSAFVSLFVIAGFVVGFVWLSVYSVVYPKEWDYVPYWLFGRSILTSGSPYSHDLLVALAQPLSPSTELVRELYCWYPPPTHFLFVLFGSLPFKLSLSIWFVVSFLVLLVDVYLLWKIFFARSSGGSLEDSILGVLVTAVLVLTIKPSIMTFNFAQTNFIVLLLLLLYWQTHQHWRAGFWMSVGIMLKPVLVAVPLFSLLCRKFSVLVAIVLSAVVMFVLTILVFGIGSTKDFFFNNTVGNDYPSGLAAELVNQSIYGTVLRFSGYQITDTPSLFLPLHVILVIAVVVVTVCLSLPILKKKQDDWVFAAIVSMAVLIYPATMSHYCLLLIIPAMMYFKILGEQLNYKKSAICLITFSYLLLWLNLGFYALVFNWLACLYIGYALAEDSSKSILANGRESQ